MIRIDGQVFVYVDIDNTLLFPTSALFVSLVDTISEEEIVRMPESPAHVQESFIKHAKHIQMIREFAARGFTIIAWSAGGSKWAERAILALGLEDVVNYVVSKPDWFFDDLPAQTFMPESSRIYYPPSFLVPPDAGEKH